VTREDVLAALVAGDRTRAQLAESLNVPATSAWLLVQLNALVDDALALAVDGQYKPTRKGRARVKVRVAA